MADFSELWCSKIYRRYLDQIWKKIVKILFIDFLILTL